MQWLERVRSAEFHHRSGDIPVPVMNGGQECPPTFVLHKAIDPIESIDNIDSVDYLDSIDSCGWPR